MREREPTVTAPPGSSSYEPTNTLLLYCPFDRQVTRHGRRGPNQELVCLECGRRADGLEPVSANDDRQTPAAATVAPMGRKSPRRGRRSLSRRPHTSWPTIAAAAIAVAVAVLAVVNVGGNVLAPSPRTAPVAPAEVEYLVIANTGGEGAYLRTTPNLDDRLRPWPEGVRLRVIGPDTSANEILWKQVEDPAGNRGWIPAEYTRPE